MAEEIETFIMRAQETRRGGGGGVASRAANGIADTYHYHGAISRQIGEKYRDDKLNS